MLDAYFDAWKCPDTVKKKKVNDLLTNVKSRGEEKAKHDVDETLKLVR
jgi:hypothetical protein|tara:strand:+ start:190 stop:333 length:144 start_codon:yes stop_codon:yes gene_type:complete